MDNSSRSPIKPVRLADAAKALPALVPDAPRMVRGAVKLLSTTAKTRNSVGRVFQRAAAAHPDRPFLRFEGKDVTYREANDQVNRYAAVFAENGVTRGSVVGVLASNRPSTLLVALAAVKLGAVAGMLNYNQRGDVLDHSLKLLDAKVIVVGAESKEALDSISGAPQGVVLGLRNGDETLEGHPDLDDAASSKSAPNPTVCEEIRAKEKAFYIFTSGTTGMPKASTMSHMRWLKSMAGLGGLGVRLHADDVLYSCLPLYHNNALTVSLSSVLSSGATMAIGRSFSVSRFWDEIIQNDATAFCYIGELCRYLLNQDPKPTEKQHKVRVIVGNGLRPEIWDEFQERFGIERIAEFYGASECNLAFVNALNVDKTAGICPLPFAIVEYDEEKEQPRRNSNGNLKKVKTGEAGLLITKITSRAPFDGYTDPAATEKKVLRDAFKKGDEWFNTGDLVYKQGFNHIAFADRLGDTFRWKGENVATTEVEGALGSLPEVDQAVVYGVAVPGTDGKAGMAAINLHDGAKFDGKKVAAHLIDSLPSYAVPLFVRIIDEVKQTSTFKSQKVDLRNAGYDSEMDDPIYVLASKQDGYVEFYDSYPDDVAAGKIRV
ncbi:long-chain-acyl-CoA synthetase [Hoyosella rhizosphaerae]|uniref:Fatty-acid-CoA ligase FadD n=1 Tax=Hoyosella rhizosphaerae TaxID=1755582 RepID=A0A916UHJ5_9ACTN|nr:long-chain-acyl-CoA synthetase [Hoyosella rhizosphaerae]MBN4928213.1 long-chain-acyl-CoA synthetase [Hoyosella rhizosphaerae]GGC73280.1 putative fatty-acid-CoA ligase FadD [Hoyosella rhizosphaerae]